VQNIVCIPASSGTTEMYPYKKKTYLLFEEERKRIREVMDVQ